MKNIELRPLGKAQAMVEAVRLDVTYAYDDLVFVEHNPFLLRFDTEEASRMFLHFNVDCEAEELVKLQKKLVIAAENEGIDLETASKYTLLPNEETSELEIHFQA